MTLRQYTHWDSRIHISIWNECKAIGTRTTAYNYQCDMTLRQYTHTRTQLSPQWGSETTYTNQMHWLKTYLSNRSFSVIYGSTSSSTLPSPCGVPQGCLGPILFAIYVSPTASIVSSRGVNQQQYAMNTVFLFLLPASLSSVFAASSGVLLLFTAGSLWSSA